MLSAAAVYAGIVAVRGPIFPQASYGWITIVAIASRTAVDNRERLSQLRDFLDRSRKELSDMIYNTGQTETPGSTPDVGQA